MKVKVSLVERIKMTKVRWFGHNRMKMMTDNRLPKNIFEWMTRGRRKRGRPKLMWKQNIAQTMRERGWEDRFRWRVAVNSKNGKRKSSRHCKT